MVPDDPKPLRQGLHPFAIPASIVVGCTIIAAAILLRGNSPKETPAVTPSGGASLTTTKPSLPSLPPPTTATESATTAASVLERDFELRIAEQARLGLEAHRADYNKTCWLPYKDKGEPQAVFGVTFAFDAEGNELTRSVQPWPGQPFRDDMAGCVAKTKGMNLKIPPPGRAVTTTTQFNFP